MEPGNQQRLIHVDSPAAVGRRLREVRERVGLTQRQLAFPGATAAYISRIEKGDRVPSLQILREFAQRLGVSESYLARGADETAPADPLLEIEVALRLEDLELARNLLTAVADEGGVATRARRFAALGQVAFREGDTARAIELLERSLDLHPQLVDVDAAVADTLGRAYAMLEQFEMAIALFERLMLAATERDDILERVRFAVLLANTLVDSGNFARAEEVLGGILARTHELADPLARARLLWSQSRLRALQNDAAEAARYAQMALRTLQAGDYPYYAAWAHQLLAHIELDRGRAAEALELLERGLPLVEQTGNVVEQALFRLEEARALLQLGRREEAASVAMHASQVLRGASPLDAGRSYALVAEVFAELGDEARAIELYELALEALETTPTRYLLDVYGRLADLLEAAGRKDEALVLLRRAMRVQRTVGRALVRDS